MENQVLIRIRNLCKFFPIKKGLLKRTVGYIHAVNGISLDILKGETLGIVGESGCGKSTFGRCLLGLIPATSGSVQFNDHSIFLLNQEEKRSLKRNMQIIFQDPFGSLNPRFRVREIIEEPLIAHEHLSKKEMDEKAKKLLADVGLDSDYLGRYPHEFSGGQRQRISIARALALNPAFIVCDEAVSALDVSTQSQVLNLLRELQTKYELTYLFISHNLSVINYISDRVGVMYLGNLMELAPVDAIYNNYMHPYTEALLAAIPSVDERKSNKLILPGDVPNPANPPAGCPFHPRCLYCKDKCKNEIPILHQTDENHFVACHSPLSHKSLNMIY